MLDWWHTVQLATGDRQRLLTALRWATLGYHHNWDTKRYSERRRHRFPDDLAQLTGYVASVLGVSGSGSGAYEAQAAIVNFYPQGTTLAGHTDHSERDLMAPLFSFRYFRNQTAYKPDDHKCSPCPPVRAASASRPSS